MLDVTEKKAQQKKSFPFSVRSYRFMNKQVEKLMKSLNEGDLGFWKGLRLIWMDNCCGF